MKRAGEAVPWWCCFTKNGPEVACFKKGFASEAIPHDDILRGVISKNLWEQPRNFKGYIMPSCAQASFKIDICTPVLTVCIFQGIS